jgi:hypothetical protein
MTLSVPSGRIGRVPMTVYACSGVDFSDFTIAGVTCAACATAMRMSPCVPMIVCERILYSLPSGAFQTSTGRQSPVLISLRRLCIWAWNHFS